VQGSNKQFSTGFVLVGQSRVLSLLTLLLAEYNPFLAVQVQEPFLHSMQHSLEDKRF
jgi:hypothetical protein